jgi:hypothetical protein
MLHLEDCPAGWTVTVLARMGRLQAVGRTLDGLEPARSHGSAATRVRSVTRTHKTRYVAEENNEETFRYRDSEVPCR